MFGFRVSSRSNARRIMLWSMLLTSIAFSLLFLLPPLSRAKRQATVQINSSSAKRSRVEYVPGRVIVRYRNEAIAKRKQQVEKTLQLADRQLPMQIDSFEGAEIVQGLRIARVPEADTMDAINALKQQPDVLYAEPDYIMHADVTPNDPQFGSQYGWIKVGAPTAWNTTTGSNNIVVGIIDEGIDINHPDLAANIFNNPAPGSISGISGDLHGYDFFHNSGTIPAGDHATHTSGTVGAVGNNGIGVTGMNWQVKLMSLKFLDNNNGSDSDAIRACNYARQMRQLFVSSGGTQGANIRVLNNSYGGGGFSQGFLDAINALNDAGILFVASAGNDATDTDVTPHYPSGYNAPNVISVVATDSNDNLAGFSSFGAQSASLGAPGVSILSTVSTVNNPPYASFSGTSMASPHCAGAAALLLAANPNLTVQQLKSLLLFNGDSIPSLNGKTLTGRRLNVANSMAALQTNDTIPPGTVTNFQVNSQNGRSLNLSWTASGDDGSVGQASLYQLTFTDAVTGAVVPLINMAPPTSGTPQNLTVKVPIGHTKGTVSLREFDNVGNEGIPATTNVNISFVDGNPYAMTLGAVGNQATGAVLTTGGTHLNLQFDDRYLENYALPFSFPFFGQTFNTVTISTNGNLYFSTPPKRSNGDADDVPSSVAALGTFKMISGLWDDLYLGTDQRADADVYYVQPDANTAIFRWQGVPCNAGPSGSCLFGGSPINFEIELRSNGIIQVRYGSGNNNIFPVVGISGGEPDPYVSTTETSETIATSLNNAQRVTFIPRANINPVDFPDFFVSQHYRDFLSREPEGCTLKTCGSPDCGLQYWSEQLTGNTCNNPAPCPNQTCVNNKRVDVSNAFFFEQEYQQTGAYAFRLYRIAYGNNQPFPNSDNSNQTEAKKLPAFSKFKPDRQSVVGGGDLATKLLALANAFVGRSEFTTRYPASLATADQFVDAILSTLQNDLGVNLNSQRTSLINVYNGANGGRGAVLYRLADENASNPINNQPLLDEEYSRAFVYTEYAGYLQRDADIGGFLFWLGQVNNYPLRNTFVQHAMVCSYMTSAEYQLRFSLQVTHSNQECPQ